MKDTHLTLRLPRALGKALADWARRRGVPKSQLAREAVERYLAAPETPTAPAAESRAAAPATLRHLTARDLAARWPLLPHLSPIEATDISADLEARRRALPGTRAPWE